MVSDIPAGYGKTANLFLQCTLVLSGMEEYIAADPIGFDHHQLLARLQNLSLDWRLSDPFASLVG